MAILNPFSDEPTAKSTSSAAETETQTSYTQTPVRQATRIPSLSSDQIHADLQRWKAKWAPVQAQESHHPLAFWEAVADEVIEGRMAVWRQSHDHNPNLPLGKTQIGSPACDYLMSRNAVGMQREKDGNLPGAIFLFEAAVADLFWGSHPYNRLRILYTRQKHYTDALRVCKEYLKLTDRPGLDKPHFQHHVEQLDKKIARQAATS
jgi:hypothetical protein